MSQVIDAVVAACADAEVSLERFPVADIGVYCLAGADLPVDDRRIARWLRSRRVTGDDIVRNDTFAVLRAGTDRTWGVGVVCGYGTNCSGVSPEGRITRFPSVGPISGDWGGGAEVGGAGLWYAIRAEDGRGEKTTLTRLVPEHFGLRRPKQVLEALYLGRIDEARTRRARARRVPRRDRGRSDRSEHRGPAGRRGRGPGGDGDQAAPHDRSSTSTWCSGAGSSATRTTTSSTRIDEGVQAVAPAARTHVLTAPPVLGAALMGLDHLGAGPAAQRRLRACLDPRPAHRPHSPATLRRASDGPDRAGRCVEGLRQRRDRRQRRIARDR